MAEQSKWPLRPWQSAFAKSASNSRSTFWARRLNAPSPTGGTALYKAVPPVGDGAFRRLAQKVDLELLALFAKADCHGRSGHFDCSAMDWFVERARTLGVQNQPPAPIVLGRHLLDLGVPPGPRMGTILKALYERQLDCEIQTLEQGIQAARELIEA